MMKLNNKGMTLMELLVSIVLLSMVLVFLIQLITDLKNETDNNNYVYTNQVNRTDALYTIQKDFMDYNYALSGVEDASSSGNITLKFYFQNASCTDDCTTITTELVMQEENGSYYLIYTNLDGEKTKWEMNGATVDMQGTYSFYNNNSNFFLKINIYLYNSSYHEGNNENDNNAIDDIEITYEGYSSYLTNNSSYLTYSNVTNKCFGYNCS